MSRQSSPMLRWVFRMLFVVAIVAFAQFLLMMVQISGAQESFRRLGAELSTAGEHPMRRNIAAALKYDGFEVDPNMISIKKSGTGSATIELVAVKEAKILFFHVAKEVEFHAEALYEPSL